MRHGMTTCRGNAVVICTCMYVLVVDIYTKSMYYCTVLTFKNKFFESTNSTQYKQQKWIFANGFLAGGNKCDQENPKKKNFL